MTDFLVVRLANIVSPNDFTISYKTGRTPGDITTGFTSYGTTYSGGTTEVIVSGVSLSFETQYWFKITDVVTNRYTIRNIYTHEDCYFPCMFISPTPTVTPSNTITPTITPSETITPTVTPTITPTITQSSTPTPSETPTPTITPTVTKTPVFTLTPTQTITSTATVTPSETPTLTPSPTRTPTKTSTPTVTPSTPSYTITVQGIDKSPGDDADFTVYCYYSIDNGTNWLELGSSKLNASTYATFGSVGIVSGTNVKFSLEIGPGTNITFGESFGVYTGYCGRSAPYTLTVSGTQTVSLNPNVIFDSISGYDVYDDCSLVASPTPTPTRTTTPAPSPDPVGISALSGTTAAEACYSGTSVTIFSSSPPIGINDYIYTDQLLSILAVEGWYAVAGTTYYVESNGRIDTTPTSCPAEPPPPPPPPPVPTTVYYDYQKCGYFDLVSIALLDTDPVPNLITVSGVCHSINDVTPYATPNNTVVSYVAESCSC